MTSDTPSQSDPGRDKDLLQALEGAGLPILTSDQARQSISRDASLYAGEPIGHMRFPTSAGVSECSHQLRQMLALARDRQLPLTFVGSRTSASGQASNRRGIVVDMSTFDRIGRISHIPEAHVVTEPGVILDDLNERLRRRTSPAAYANGCEHSLDLSSSYMATIGGAIMNNGGGILATKYGSACDNVLDLEILLPDGRTTWTSKIQDRGEFSDIYREILRLIRSVGPETILRAMPRLRKNASGYHLLPLAKQAMSGEPLDMTQLFVGSEGTLGTLLRAKVKVRPVAAPQATALVFFASLAEMAHAVEATLRIEVEGRPIVPSAIEVISGSIFGIIQDLDIALPAVCVPPPDANAAGLLVEYNDPPHVAHAALDALRQVCAEYIPASTHGTETAFRMVTSPEQRSDFWLLRKDIVKILNAYGSRHGLFAPPVIEDVGVPIEQLGALLHFLHRELERDHLRAAIYGHAGDGNLHIRPLFQRDAEHMELAWQLMDKVHRQVVAMGGTITAEHGDGHLRTPYLPLQYGTTITSLYKQIKEIFDPDYIMNPGVKVPHPSWPDRQFRDWDVLGFQPTGGGRPSRTSSDDIIR